MFVCPLVPNRNPVLLKVLDVGLTSQKPKQLVSDKAERNPFGRKQRKGVLEGEPHLGTEEAAGACAGPIGFGISVIQNPLQEFEVLLFHDESAWGSFDQLRSVWHQTVVRLKRVFDRPRSSVDRWSFGCTRHRHRVLRVF